MLSALRRGDGRGGRGGPCSGIELVFDPLGEWEWIRGIRRGSSRVLAKNCREEEFVLRRPVAVLTCIGLDARCGGCEALAGERRLCEHISHFSETDGSRDRGKLRRRLRAGKFRRSACVA